MWSMPGSGREDDDNRIGIRDRGNICWNWLNLGIITAGVSRIQPFEPAWCLIVVARSVDVEALWSSADLTTYVSFLGIVAELK